jgi:type I restriction enzyme S subunit
MTQGAAYNALTIEKLKEYKINVVDIEEQNVIVKKIKNIRNNIDKLEAIYTQKIKECDELKQSILQKAFRGEL